jgi:hypothetical protein
MPQDNTVYVVFRGSKLYLKIKWMINNLLNSK